MLREAAYVYLNLKQELASIFVIKDYNQIQLSSMARLFLINNFSLIMK